MLKNIGFTKSLDKKNYKDEVETLSTKLAALQLVVKEKKVPVVVVFEGWGASGKGTHISRLVNPLDPRFFNVNTIRGTDENLSLRPYLCPFWERTPEKGRISIFSKSWHRVILQIDTDKWKLSEKSRETFYADVNAFERQLSEDGAVIVKFFLHISKDEQCRRFEKLESNAATAWRVSDKNWMQNARYNIFLEMFENMLEQTNETPWTIVESDNSDYAEVKILRTLVDEIEIAIENQDAKKDTAPTEKTPIPKFIRDVNKTVTLTDTAYKEMLEDYQQRIHILGHKLQVSHRSVAVVYEGWDASGKGGNIKRLTKEMDPRNYVVIPVGAPSAKELSHHYLWRFFGMMPKDGQFSIFDRSWYGRVLVERVENLTPVPVWKRAYQEINEMEAHLSAHGVIIFKFWLDIDRDEQLRRFKSRQTDPFKHYKITEEDWRNREKWDCYEDAIDEMLAKTNTPYAPWTVVESNKKKYARIKVLETIAKTLELEL
ncbi:MAG: polyphosphate:AMP phosphotransferase [Defluviitaleaceae bacterium]|nr:polyphosphate:AMP phosphotransferase [Defluviitaleaceae bacterium]MCL2262202.1 polyphosphate:AMP phosphotransferase [Defluviitaleaceae bacterium]